jgi:hypothetical protein
MALTSTNNHKTHPEIWLRPSSLVSLDVLLKLVEGGKITATPRLGTRNGDHPKGYTEGDIAVLRVLDDVGTEHLSRTVRIEPFSIRPLRELTSDDLRNTIVYQSPTEVQRDLSFFDERLIEGTEPVSVIKFSYL